MMKPMESCEPKTGSRKIWDVFISARSYEANRLIRQYSLKSR